MLFHSSISSRRNCDDSSTDGADESSSDELKSEVSEIASASFNVRRDQVTIVRRTAPPNETRRGRRALAVGPFPGHDRQLVCDRSRL